MKKRLKEIEDDEWDHRKYVLDIMNALNIQPSKYFEIKYFIIGKCISLSCHILGWFIPMYFAGRLESGNVNEYIRMINLLKDNKIEGYDEVVMEMAVVEKEHEKYFAGKVKKHPFLPFFAAIFRWSHKRSFNDMNECACRNHFNSCI